MDLQRHINPIQQQHLHRLIEERMENLYLPTMPRMTVMILVWTVEHLALCSRIKKMQFLARIRGSKEKIQTAVGTSKVSCVGTGTYQHNNIIIPNALHVRNLNQTLISVRDICDTGKVVIFTAKESVVHSLLLWKSPIIKYWKLFLEEMMVCTNTNLIARKL